jgi:hypothetical protein
MNTKPSNPFAAAVSRPTAAPSNVIELATLRKPDKAKSKERWSTATAASAATSVPAHGVPPSRFPRKSDGRRPSHGGPIVRIHLPPAVSLMRNLTSSIRCEDEGRRATATRTATIVGSAAVPNRRGRFIQPISPHHRQEMSATHSGCRSLLVVEAETPAIVEGGDREPCRARGDRCTPFLEGDGRCPPVPAGDGRCAPL